MLKEINYSDLIPGHQYFIEINVCLTRGIRKNIKCKGIFVKNNNKEVTHFENYYGIYKDNEELDDSDYYMNIYCNIHHYLPDLPNLKDATLTFEDGYFPIAKRKLGLETEGFNYGLFKNVEFTNKDAIDDIIKEKELNKTFHHLMNKFNSTFTNDHDHDHVHKMWVKKPFSNVIKFYEVTKDVVVRKQFIDNLNLIADAKHVIRQF